MTKPRALTTLRHSGIGDSRINAPRWLLMLTLAFGITAQAQSQTRSIGAPLGAPIVVNQQEVRLFRGGFPLIAAARDGRFAAVYIRYDSQRQNPHLHVRGFGASGAALGDEQQVDAGAGLQIDDYALDIAANGDFTVVWRVLNSPAQGLYLRRFSGVDGRALTAPLQVLDRAVNSPRIAMADDGHFLLVWNTGLAIQSQMYDASAVPQGPTRLISPVSNLRVPYGCPILLIGLTNFGVFSDTTALSADITPSGDSAIVVWGQSRYTELPATPCAGSASLFQSRYQLRFRRLDAQGRPDGPADDAFATSVDAERAFNGQPWVSAAIDDQGNTAIGFLTSSRGGAASRDVTRRLPLPVTASALAPVDSSSDRLASDRSGRVLVLTEAGQQLFDRQNRAIADFAAGAINSSRMPAISSDGNVALLAGAIVPPYESVSNPPVIQIAVQRYQAR